MRRRRDTPHTDEGARREPAAEALERRYRRLLAWYPAAYRAANADDMLGVGLARSAPGQRWPEPGEAVNLIVSGIGERLGGMLRRPDQRDTAAVLAIAGPVLLAAAAARTIAGPFMFDPAMTFPAAPGSSACGSTNACFAAASLKSLADAGRHGCGARSTRSCRRPQSGLPLQTAEWRENQRPGRAE